MQWSSEERVLYGQQFPPMDIGHAVTIATEITIINALLVKASNRGFEMCGKLSLIFAHFNQKNGTCDSEITQILCQQLLGTFSQLRNWRN